MVHVDVRYREAVRLAVIAFTISMILAACSAASDSSEASSVELPAPDVVLRFDDISPGWLEGSSFFAIEQPTSHKVLGTANWGSEQRIIIGYETAIEPECFAVLSASGFGATCLIPPSNRSVILDRIEGFEDEYGLLVLTEPRVTEVRITTGDNTVYAVEPLGRVAYIEWPSVSPVWTLELYDRTTLVHSES